MKLYFASVLPGLETVLSNEMKHKVRDIEILKINRGKVFFSSDASLICLQSLRSADNLFQVIDQFQIGPHKKHLCQLREKIFQLDLDFIEPKDSFWVNASRKGKHSYSRFEAAEIAMEGIKKRYNWKVGTAEKHQLEFRLDIEHQDVLFSLRLTDATFRFRRTERQFSRAALIPTVAHAMVWLSEPKSTDVFVDPCCGAGTILSERSVYPGNQIIGGDHSTEILRGALANLDQSLVRLHLWDARKMPLGSSYVDKVVTNLPFGRQISTDEDLKLFNHHIMKEINRIMKSKARAVILSESVDQLVAEAEQLGFSCLGTYPLSLKGLHPTLFVFEKR